MKLVLLFTDGSRRLALDIEEAQEIILEAFSNGVLVDQIEDENGKQFGAEWSVTLTEL